jgi:hypothetical protein
MIRRVILYVLVAIAVYIGYTKYMDYAGQVQVRKSTDQIEDNQQAVEEADDPSKQSPAERALRRRQNTEKQATRAEKSVGKSDKHP